MCESRGKSGTFVKRCMGSKQCSKCEEVGRVSYEEISVGLPSVCANLERGKEDRGHKLLKMSMIQHSSEGAREEAAVVLLPTTASHASEQRSTLLPPLESSSFSLFLPFISSFSFFLFAFGFLLSGFFGVFWFVCV